MTLYAASQFGISVVDDAIRKIQSTTSQGTGIADLPRSQVAF